MALFRPNVNRPVTYGLLPNYLDQMRLNNVRLDNMRRLQVPEQGRNGQNSLPQTHQGNLILLISVCAFLKWNNGFIYPALYASAALQALQFTPCNLKDMYPNGTVYNILQADTLRFQTYCPCSTIAQQSSVRLPSPAFHMARARATLKWWQMMEYLEIESNTRYIFYRIVHQFKRIMYTGYSITFHEIFSMWAFL